MTDHDLLAWVIIGVVAGALAGRVVEGRGFGCLGDLIVGVAGALIGGALLAHFEPDTHYGLLGSTVVAFIGACILLSGLRLISGNRPFGGGPRLGRRRYW
jgi:uncharacterized membrane protein YeaQ/YmgE (transglycosylase-associated protein family)